MEPVLFISAVLIFGGIIFAVISLTNKSPKLLDITQYRSRWLSIETSLKRDEPASYTLSIVEADKLLDKALKERAYKGETMGDRMKKCQGKWTNGNGVWAAHKLRNRLVHETDFQIDYERSRQAIAAYKQALKDLGAI